MNACAFREGKAKIANSFQTDERSAAWRKIHPMEEIGSAASVPLLRNGRSVGVFLFMLKEANAITDEVQDEALGQGIPDPDCPPNRLSYNAYRYSQ